MSIDSSPRDRAGFWRRLLSYLIDYTWIPTQIIAAILFATTSGLIQQTGGITFTTCATDSQIPAGLMPPPPADSNFSTECNVYFFGAQTASYVRVGRSTKNGSISRTYMLDREGHPIDAIPLDWLPLLAFIAYVIVFETRTGATLGSRVTRIRVLDPTAAGVTRVPLRKTIIRYFGLFLGLAPMFAIFLFYLALYGGDLEAIMNNNIFIWTEVTAGGLALAWAVVLLVQIATKRDPLYDGLAGTAVVRT